MAKSVAELERKLVAAEDAWKSLQKAEADGGQKLPWDTFIKFAAVYLSEHGVYIGKRS